MKMWYAIERSTPLLLRISSSKASIHNSKRPSVVSSSTSFNVFSLAIISLQYLVRVRADSRLCACDKSELLDFREPAILAPDDLRGTHQYSLIAPACPNRGKLRIVSGLAAESSQGDFFYLSSNHHCSSWV